MCIFKPYIVFCVWILIGLTFFAHLQTESNDKKVLNEYAGQTILWQTKTLKKIEKIKWNYSKIVGAKRCCQYYTYRRM